MRLDRNDALIVAGLALALLATIWLGPGWLVALLALVLIVVGLYRSR